MIFTFSLLLTLLTLADALPKSPGSLTIPLLRKRSPERNGAWARKQRESLCAKYGGCTSDPSSSKRATSGHNQLINQNGDSSYYGSLAVGTPPVSFNVILDTGSSDMWLAGQGCGLACRGVPKYNPTVSRTFKNRTTPFHITYGSGEAAGILAQDIVQMAGFQVPDQVFAICNLVSQNLLNAPVSGLLGLAFQTIATSQAPPFWQTLATGGALSQPLFSFFITRFVDDSDAAADEVGGEFLLGATNTSLYTGDIDFIDMPTAVASYWMLPLTNLIVQGSSIPLPSGSSSFAAIDTGTTLVGGPPSAIQAIFAQIPNSSPGVGDYQSYWVYPCDTTVQVQLSFGGRTWNIDPLDFKLAELQQNQCIGAFFELEMSGSAPAWIMGDSFLKNVYSVFQAPSASSSVARIGFAELSTTAKNLAIAGAPLPTPTIGSNPAQVTLTNGVGRVNVNVGNVAAVAVAVAMAKRMLCLWF
ncbi:aspartic peptidase domain-containing protein [Hysterangium stoloniferum]|nr:aspartic peptidase domain-containing protein [Hysterangium stoloniferum]